MSIPCSRLFRVTRRYYLTLLSPAGRLDFPRRSMWEISKREHARSLSLSFSLSSPSPHIYTHARVRVGNYFRPLPRTRYSRSTLSRDHFLPNRSLGRQAIYFDSSSGPFINSSRKARPSSSLALCARETFSRMFPVNRTSFGKVCARTLVYSSEFRRTVFGELVAMSVVRPFLTKVNFNIRSE